MDDDQLARQRHYREKTGNASTKRYERTKKGKLMRLYRNMYSRINGIQKKNFELYKGKALLTKEEFYEWACGHPAYERLYHEWADSGFERKLAPSVDRVDPEKGYTIDNMEWVTHSENSRRSSKSIRSTNKSGVVGVHWASQQGKWHAVFEHNGKKYHVGFYTTIHDAKSAILSKRQEILGDCASTVVTPEMLG